MTEEHLRIKYQLYLIRHNNKVKAHNNGSSYHMKDSERNKTYKSEWALWKRFPEINKNISKKEAEKYFTRVCKSKYWEGRSVPQLNWMKDMGAGRRVNGRATMYQMDLSPSGASKYVILHEMAHVAGFSNHGRGFRIELIKLVSRFLGRGVAAALKEEFRARGLKTSKIRDPLPYEQWKAKYERNSGLLT